MLLFYGVAGCSLCHNGPLLSDFSFHSLGVPGRERSKDKIDKGRYRVTNDKADLFAFRTPPLRNVAQTGPYFHNGFAKTIKQVIHQHFDPYLYADIYGDTGEPLLTKKQIASISPLLDLRGELDGSDVEAIAEFLNTLSGGPDVSTAQIIPNFVPSGIPISSIIEPVND
jgi:cytochrome c peroxidase